ncbi:putative porin [Aestuariivivens sediminis]|uniref:putative porin n=1 Tax=Aestuariivivens sediminis TaxID=2913557 RepID=UPI001F5ADC06|nr:putative porin [Aestuariivivens sediminis]
MVNKVVLIGVLWCLYGGVFAQEGRRLNPESGIGNFGRQDTLSAAQRKSTGIKNIKNENAKIEDYLIISYLNDTTHVDTTLTIQKEYKFNYLRRDNFGLMPFSNLGQTYNTLTQNLQSTALMPVFGARARHFNYMEIEDINYYRVPTPLTELFFKTAFEQGQLADSFFTVNTSPRFNFSIAYKGLRSLGNYQHLLTSTGNFRFTTNYSTKNNQYHFRAHIVMQDLLNQENGGLRDDMVENFESGIAEFLDRSLLEVNFENAESILKGKRFHVEHAYSIIRKKDSLSKNNMSIGHIMSFKDKFYEFSQTSAVTAYFGQASENSIKDKVTLENFYNQFYVSYSNDLLGDLQFNLNHNNYNYGYNSLYRDVKNGIDVTNRLKGDIVSAGGKYHKQFKGLELHGELGLNISGEFEGNFLNAHVGFKLNEEVFARASINHNSKVPNYNTLLYQSKYVHYNWENHFNNTESQQLAFQVKYKDFADITVDYTTLNDYVYFGEDQGTNSIKPFQSNESITYLRVKWVNELRAGKFALHNTVLYQNVQNDNEVFNVPQFITRNTLYFSSHVFKKAMYLQTGLTLNYFTKYYMNAYSPLLAEFYVQRDKEYGGFPRLDFFVNAKIRQTRIFLKAEHFNAPFTGYNYYAAPNTPYRDFIVRFGVVWNFFL